MHHKKLLVSILVLTLVLGGLVYSQADELQGRFGSIRTTTPTKSTTTTTTALPDLEVSFMSLSSSNNLSLEVRNVGTADVALGTAGHTTIDLFDSYSDYVNDRYAITSYDYNWNTLSDRSFMAAGGESTISLGLSNSDPVWVKVCMDTTQIVTESSESNCGGGVFNGGTMSY